MPSLFGPAGPARCNLRSAEPPVRGPVRTQWEHSIPAVAALRYSITFRSRNG